MKGINERKSGLSVADIAALTAQGMTGRAPRAWERSINAALRLTPTNWRGQEIKFFLTRLLVL